ncbi:uncharacterized protein LOC123558758 [Mercenaria mercenaria]|uniref:uncharacterized protein LOC123558758 n=1 Tax=Mercenaria mercenaria TaxID=6596 RepID=UPI00234EFA39|nr:uncharacterized protein LOC123558758 [Mercenaria mercenaria]
MQRLDSLLILALVNLSFGLPNVEIREEEGQFQSGEDVIVAKDETGEVLTTVFRYMNEGFQIEKTISDLDPACYLREIEHKGMDGNTCFRRIPVPLDTSDEEELRTKCEDRPIFLLKPIGCERSESGMEIRRRRDNSYDCILEKEITAVCVHETKACCKWICFKKKCTKCLKTESKVIYVEKCGFDI